MNPIHALSNSSNLSNWMKNLNIELQKKIIKVKKTYRYTMIIIATDRTNQLLMKNNSNPKTFIPIVSSASKGKKKDIVISSRIILLCKATNQRIVRATEKERVF